MLRALPKLFVASVLLAVNACGFTDAGDGTNTLEVQINGVYRFGANNEMRLEVQVNRSGNGVDDATVIIVDDNAGETITLDQQGGQGHYRKDVSGYRRRLAVEVRAGTDNLTAQLEGPGAHLIEQPQNNATVGKNSDLDIEWSTKDGIRADEIIVELENSDYVSTIRGEEESGTYSVPSGSLRDSSDLERIYITRRAKVTPAGGSGSSSFAIEYRVENSFLITP